MLGAIIGDIVGSRYEFNPTNEYNFEMFAAGSGFTDDTVCTIAVADALLRHRDYGASLHEWCRRYPHPKGGYGGRFAQWVQSCNPYPYGSFGNGSAMRVSPIGWWFHSEEEVRREAEKSAACTHNHPQGIIGAQAVALAIFDCQKLRGAAKACSPSRNAILDKGLHRALLCYTDSPSTWRLRIQHFRNRFDETCQGTVPVALWIVLNSSGFEDALRKAVSLGADADTLGAIVGSIAEAIWGIPEWMKKKALAMLPEEMQAVVHRFHSRVVERRREWQKKQEFQTVMLWKLGLGNMGKFFNGEDSLPSKEKVATKQSWHIEPWPEDANEWSLRKVYIRIPFSEMSTVRRGHIPDAQEDHWFMYADGEYIRYYRSWTGMPAFEAHYTESLKGCIIDSVKMNKNLCEFGVNGDLAGLALFKYLVFSEATGHSEDAWQEYLRCWEDLHRKYSK